MRILVLAVLTAVFAIGCSGGDAANSRPTIDAQSVTTTEDTPVTISLQASDPEGSELTLTITPPLHGTVSRVGLILTYTPEANFNGADAILVTASDGQLEAQVSVAITVNPANDEPTAADDALAANEDTTLTVQASSLVTNDSDIDGDALTVTAVSDAMKGTASLTNGVITFVPAANYAGAASFTYTVSDGKSTDKATVNVTVGGANDAPVAVDDAATTTEDTPVTVPGATLVANDTDVEAQTLSVTAVSNANGGTVALAAGTITFTPTANFNGTAGFDYTVSDGADSDTGRVTVSVSAVNDAPVATDDAQTAPEDGVLTATAATLVANDTDVDGQTLTLSAVSNATNGSVSLSGTTVTFTPTADFNGAAGFDYTVTDGALTDTGHVTVTVTSVNDAPVAVDDVATTNEDAQLTLAATALLANDTDGDGQPLTVTSVSAPTNGTVTLSGTTITFTPAANFNGTATFSYTASDGAASDVASVTVTVTAVADAPVATDDTASTAEDAAATIAASTLLSNDADADGQTLSVTAVTNATNGTVSLSGTTITFTPAANFTGTAGFDYTVSDGALSDTGHVDVTVTAANDAPVAVDDAATTNEDSALSLTAATLLLNDTDADGQTLTITAVANATNGTVSLSGTTITFTPTANFSGAATFEYTVSDSAATDVGLVTVTVTGVNDAPVAVDDTASTSRNVALNIAASSLLSNDTDDDGQTLTVTAVSNATNGTVTLSGTTITFTPASNFVGAAGFDYTTSDGALSDTGRVTVTVVASNTAPVAVDDSVTMAEDTQLTLAGSAVLANDIDPDPQTLTVTAVSNASVGTVSLSGSTITFTPPANFNGAATFDYTVSDGLATDQGRVDVTVTSVNDVPVAANQSRSTPRNTALQLTLTATDADLGAGTLTFAVSGAPANGTLGTITQASPTSATVTYTPNSNFAGADNFTFTASDAADTSLPAVVSLTITASSLCGNGFIEAPETCDDNDTDSGDGCSASCAIENGWSCAGEPSFCITICNDGVHIADEEECDDGNQVETDGCTTSCRAGVVCSTATASLSGADRFATNPSTGVCYASFDTEQTTFSAAQSACISAGGHLATITGAFEQTYVSAVHNTSENPWIGATDELVEGTFEWVTGETFSYSNYEPSQPDDAFGGEDCLHLYSSAASPSGQAGKWADTGCNLTTFTGGRICELAGNSCGDSFIQASRGETCDDANVDPFDGCDGKCRTETLFISEYAEGTSSNKAIEIANPLMTAVNLGAQSCALRIYFNGLTTFSTINLTNTIPAQDVLVVCNASATNLTLTAACDVLTGALTFNGDDAVMLVCGGTIIDGVGEVGVDPGTEWTTAGKPDVSTEDNTLWRRCDVTRGNGGTLDVSTAWGGFATDYFEGLGSYDCIP